MKKYILSVMLIGIILCNLTACTTGKTSGPLQKGRRLEEDGDYTAALRKYRGINDEEFRQISSNNLYYLYGDILEAMAAIKGDPSSEQYYKLAQAYYDKAETIPEGAEIAPNAELDLHAYFAQQREQLQTNAMKALDKATELQPDNDEALLLEGIIYEEKDEPEKAITVYEEVLQFNPENPEFFVRLGRLLHEQGEFEIGRKLVEQAIADAPGNAEAHFTLGNIYAEQGSENLAIEEFHQTICLDPHHIETYYSIARFFLAQNNLIDTERVMQLGISNNPDSLPMGLFYNSLKSVLDRQEQESVRKIIQQLEGGFVPDNVQQINISQQNFETQLRYFDLRLKLIQRQRPYLLPCSEFEENPYFEKQIGQTQAKLEEIKQLLTASE